MGVIRVEHNDNYTTMANYHLRDRRLSLRAMGLMSKMLSLPVDWDYSVAGLTSICKEGREAVRKALQELEGTGYLVREQSRQGGSFAGYDYILFEQPQDPEGNTPSPKNPSTVEPPSPKKPSTDFPSTGNPPQLNNEINKKTKQTNAPAWEPEMFERFWKAYPRGENKADARREWDKLKPDHALMMAMSAALQRAKTSEEWRRGIGIPYACRWLSKRRWEDDLAKEATVQAPVQEPEEVVEWI